MLIKCYSQKHHRFRAGSEHRLRRLNFFLFFGRCYLRPAAFATRPFCSKRCADIDLYRWLRGAYTIPVGRETETGENDEDWQHPTEIPDA